MGWHARP